MKEINLQLYSLHNKFEEDFAGTMQKVADMGYTGVEFAGYGGLTAIQMKELLAKCGLTAVSSHVSLEKLEDNLNGEIEYLQTLGCNYIVCPMANMETAEDAAGIAKRLNHIAEKCAFKGMNFAYHNHGHEFGEVDGELLIDIMMSHCNELVQLELDVFWITHADREPIEEIRKNAGRAIMVHLKELARIDGEKKSVALGEGEINFPEIIKTAEKTGVEHFFVEQEWWQNNSFEQCAKSAKYLKNLFREGT